MINFPACLLLQYVYMCIIIIIINVCCRCTVLFLYAYTRVVIIIYKMMAIFVTEPVHLHNPVLGAISHRLLSAELPNFLNLKNTRTALK